MLTELTMSHSLGQAYLFVQTKMMMMLLCVPQLGREDLFALTKITLTGCGLSIVGSLLCVFLACYVPWVITPLLSHITVTPLGATHTSP